MRTSWVPLAIGVASAMVFVSSPRRDGAPGVDTWRFETTDADVLRGRQLVLNHGCADCHIGGSDPTRPNWLAGDANARPDTKVGAFQTYPRNLTPDNETGLGGVTERQIYNALRYGLKPKMTPDVEITSTIPGEGNHPVKPHYLAPTMPWVAFRHMTDRELRDIAAYLKRGVRPVSLEIPASEAPADSWAGEYASIKLGPFPAAAFPAVSELASSDPQVKDGRKLVIEHACGECHGGVDNPSSPDWLQGSKGKGPLAEFPIGPFRTRPRNLTPDNLTGLGRFSERQIFNALRYGLRPGETPDVQITSTTPGIGNFPVQPKFLAPPMPWPAFRHMSDAELMAIAAYLKRGLKPRRNRVADSEGPPDFWASEYTAKKLGPYPPAAFPTVNEKP